MKLGQAVALKFLPPGLDAHPDRLARFLGEVRTARQVSHPNVCRIYDAGEADGQHFLSMEYVDGEDLASLLRRIGHLPSSVSRFVPETLGGAPALPDWTEWSLEPLRGTVPALVTVAGIHTKSLMEIIYPVTSLVIFRLLLRRTALALVAVGLLAIVLFYPDSGSIPVYIVWVSISIALAWAVLFRGGLLAFFAFSTMTGLIGELPLTPHPPGWFFGTTLLLTAFVLAPVLYGFWTSQAGRPLFGEALLEPAVRR